MSVQLHQKGDLLQAHTSAEESIIHGAQNRSRERERVAVTKVIKKCEKTAFIKGAGECGSPRDDETFSQQLIETTA